MKTSANTTNVGCILCLLASLLLVHFTGFSQSFVFAQLNGTPANTNGWNLQGFAYVGNTGTNTGNGEIILTDPTNFQSGAVFYNTPINLAQCNKWIAEFEFRINEGTAADGIAFCYLDVPPSGFVSGGGVGIPATANGLKIVVDTWKNCGNDEVPKLEMRWGTGYDECMPQPTAHNNNGQFNFIRSGAYHKMKIEYNDGAIRVLINGTEYLTGNQTFNFTGYFGITSSTGGSNDRHSIRNFVIYTEMPPSDAGNATFAGCSSAFSTIGTQSDAKYTYKWSPSVGLSDPTASNPTITLLNLGNTTTKNKYYVETAYVDKPGCSSKDSIEIITYPASRVAFSHDSLCFPGGVISFNNLTTYNNLAADNLFTWKWKFGDTNATPSNPDSSDGKQATHAYFSTQPFNVSLTATSPEGCKADTTITISPILPKPTATFTAKTEVCLRDSTLLFSTATAPNGHQIKSYVWDVGTVNLPNSANPGFVYNNAGTYNQKHWVISDRGCHSDTATAQQIIHPLPTAAFTYNATTCAVNPITFTSQSIANAGQIIRWFWKNSDNTVFDSNNGNPIQYTFPNAGNKSVQLLVATDKGCKSDTLSKTIVVNPLPALSFVLPEVCLSDAFADFANTTTITNGTGSQMNYKWNFGDPAANASNPNTSLQRNGRHKYSASGSYQVQLTATSVNNCVDSITQTLIVNGDNPKADFTIENTSQLCGNALLIIKNTSTVNFGSITKIEIFWDWPSTSSKTTDNDPTTNKLYNRLLPDFNTPASKVYQIRMVAYSGIICVNETIQSVTVHARPKVQFTTMPGICLSTVNRLITQGTNIGVVSGSGLYKGNGISSNGLFTPTVTGTFPLTYVFTSTMGCKDSVNRSITVWPRPIANFTIDSPRCIAQPITFRDVSTTPIQTIIQRQWDFGDNTSANRTNNASFTKTYAATGTYPVQVTAVTDSGCLSLPKITPVIVRPLPVPDFTTPVVCLPDGRALFTNQSTIPDGTQGGFTYLWNFGVAGAASATTKDGNFRYNTTGPFTITLQVTSNNGCKAQVAKVLTDINFPPKASFTATPSFVCLGDRFTFTNTSVAPSGQNIAVYNWLFGDGTKANTADASHLYTKAGTFPTKLWYTTNRGCFSDTATVSTIVHPYPIVNAGPDFTILQGDARIITASVAGSSNYSYVWTPFDYLSNPQILQPLTQPDDNVTYRLTVTGAGGCSSFDEIQVKVLFRPIIPNAFSPNGDGINDTWQIKHLELYPNATVQLFDRYGQQVLPESNYNRAWDGTYKGKPVPVGTYYYIIKPKSGRLPVKGSVTVVR